MKVHRVVEYSVYPADAVLVGNDDGDEYDDDEIETDCWHIRTRNLARARRIAKSLGEGSHIIKQVQTYTRVRDRIWRTAGEWVLRKGRFTCLNKHRRYCRAYIRKTIAFHVKGVRDWQEYNRPENLLRIAQECVSKELARLASESKEPDHSVWPECSTALYSSILDIPF